MALAAIHYTCRPLAFCTTTCCMLPLWFQLSLHSLLYPNPLFQRRLSGMSNHQTIPHFSRSYLTFLHYYLASIKCRRNAMRLRHPSPRRPVDNIRPLEPAANCLTRPRKSKVSLSLHKSTCLKNQCKGLILLQNEKRFISAFLSYQFQSCHNITNVAVHTSQTPRL